MELAWCTRELLHGLRSTEERVLRQRFGPDGAPRTLQEIGDERGVSRERVRQIEAGGLTRLRGIARRAGLQEQLECGQVGGPNEVGGPK